MQIFSLFGVSGDYHKVVSPKTLINGHRVDGCLTDINSCFQCARHVVMLESPATRIPQFRSFGMNVLHQMLQNIMVALGINCLTMGVEFMVLNLANVKENLQHAFGCAPDLTQPLWSWSFWALPVCFPDRSHRHKRGSST